LVILLANEVHAHIFSFIAVALLIMFTAIGWLNTSGVVIGLAILVAGLVTAIQRKKT